MSLIFPDLPAPEIIDPSTYEEIFDRRLARFRTIAPDYTNLVEGDPVYMLIQAESYEELNLRERVNNAYRQTNIIWANGTNLDVLAANVNLTRQVKTPAVLDSLGNIETPAVLETDDQLRRRYLLAWHALGSATFGWYSFHALNSSEDVKDAFPRRTADGEVTVAIQAEGDDPVPSSTLLSDVETYMNANDRRILCDTLVIAAITKVEYTITAEITVEVEADRQAMLDKVTDAVEAFAEESEAIDRDIPLSRLYAILNPDGVASVDLTSPTANITTTNSQVPVATTITITAA